MTIDTINPNAAVNSQTSAGPTTSTMVEKTHVFEANLQKQLLLEYNKNLKIKTQEWAKLIADKMSLMNIIFGQ